MISELVIPDGVVIGFFTAVVTGLAGAVVVLWKQLTKTK